MLGMYVVLDGFDLGVGILYLILGKQGEDRRKMLGSIGPVWDGNEVWLLAAGGTLYFAFPMLYASSFSGFYLPLMIVLWLLILRGAGIEFRHQIHHPMWQTFWDIVFSTSSILLSIFFGAALGNVIRGVPLNKEGYFFEPLWTTFTVVPEAGILDWFTIIMGIVALLVLTVHGANYIALKTGGGLQERARRAAGTGWWGVMISSGLALISTFAIRPQTWDNFSAHPWGYVFPLAGLLALFGMKFFIGKDLLAFLSSSTFIIGMLVSTAFGLYPNLLVSSTDPAYAITVYNARAHDYGLRVGLIWWIIGMVLTVTYFTVVFRVFRGKVSDQDGY